MIERSNTGNRSRRSVVAGLTLVVAVFVFGTFYGFYAGNAKVFPYGMVRSLYYRAAAMQRPPYVIRMDGRWRPAQDNVLARDITDEQQEEMARIAALGYLTGVNPAPEVAGVTVYDKGRAYDGLNLFTSGHGPEAFLTDMNGRVLHKWSYDFRSVWPDREIPTGASGSEYWRRAYLFENGDLLAIFGTFGIVKLDKYSNLLWDHPGGCHHDVFVMPDGSIYVLDYEARLIPRYDERLSVMVDFITVLNSAGEVQSRVSVLEALERSRYAGLLDDARPSGDILHTNTIEPLDGRLAHRSPAFREGNVLISTRNLDAVAVVDTEAGEVVWALADRWHQQHQPTLLENGRMLLFNNIAGEEVSEVIEFDPFTQEIQWSFKGDTTNSFYSETQGSCERLPNGNTLISETDNGRAFEVTPGGEIVWEFVNPHRAGDDDELIATLPEMTRLPPDFPLDWIDPDRQ